MSRIAYVDGRYVAHRRASIHVEDRGFQFADGVYEVIAVIRGRRFDEPRHLDRLERSLGEIDMPMPMTRSALGCVMDSLSMILLTIPVFFPIIAGLDFGLGPEETAIWFGILALIVVEVGLITPPVGMNVFVINALADGVPMAETFKGVTPFLVSDVVRIALLVAFPGIALWLPRVLS